MKAIQLKHLLDRCDSLAEVATMPCPATEAGCEQVAAFTQPGDHVYLTCVHTQHLFPPEAQVPDYVGKAARVLAESGKISFDDGLALVEQAIREFDLDAGQEIGVEVGPTLHMVEPHVRRATTTVTFPEEDQS